MRANRLVVITGLSGSGKSVALRTFEDMGYFCVDNLPAPLIPKFVDFLIDIPAEWEGSKSVNLGTRDWRFALCIDGRESYKIAEIAESFEQLKALGTELIILFFDCSDEVILRRFRETRRVHPISRLRPSCTSLTEAIAKEREILSGLRGMATRIIDTTAYNPHDLRRVVEGIFQHESLLEISVQSFGFKHGAPTDADLVFDVRFLPNPHFVPELKELTGLDEAVSRFVFSCNETKEFLTRLLSLLEFTIPGYEREGKRYLTIAIGCTGGKHRSVALAEHIAKQLSTPRARVVTRHRDKDK